MSARRFALIDPAAGASGDMFLGALIDVGASPAWLRGLPARLRIEGVEIEISDVMRCGMRSTKVTVRLGGATEGPADVLDTVPEPGSHGHPPDAGHHHEHHDGPGGHHHHHGDPGGTSHHHHHGDHHHHHAHGDHPHRHVGELLAMIAAADLSEPVKRKATAAFRLLAEAEGRIHGTSPDDVMLHEVGAMDALIDIVGTIEGFEQLGVDAVHAGPVALGRGWVKAAHGHLPIPAPATSILVEGLAIAPNGPVRGEATTPTGAALIRTLVTGSMPASAWRPLRTGWGAGGRDPEGYANTLRLVIGELEGRPGETVVVIATDLDDLQPEYLEPLREALVAAGAVDVESWPIQMKKGRTGLRVEAITPVDRIDPVTEAFFVHSTTAGIRQWPVSRATLSREVWSFTASTGDQVRAKTVRAPDGIRVKPEYEDVVAIARRTGQPAHQLFRIFQEEALRAALEGEPDDGTHAIVNPKESTR